MFRTRINVLVVLVIALAAALAVRLLLSGDETAPPMQQPLTRASPMAAPTPAAPRRYRKAELNLLEFGMIRGKDEGPAPVGAAYIGTDSDEAAACLEEARTALAARDAARAADAAARGLAADPDFPQLLVEASTAALLLPDEHLAEAERFARHAAELAPMYADAHYDLACALGRQRRAADAAAALSEALRWARGERAAVLEHARGDTDLDAVRDAPEMRAVLEAP